MPQLSLAHLQSLVERARSVPGVDFETVSEKQQRGDLENPHRLVELVKRVQSMIEVFERGNAEIELDADARVALMELDRLLRHYDYAERIPGFADAGVFLTKTQDYAHTLVLLDNVWLIANIGNGTVEFVEDTESKTPDLRVCTKDRSSSWHVEVHVPRDLIHPVVGSLSADRARKLVDETLRKKKLQLRVGDSFLVMGGLGCCAETVKALEDGARTTLRSGRRPYLAGVIVYSAIVVTEEHMRPDGQIAARLHNGLRAAIVENPGYGGAVRLSSVLHPDAPLQPIDL